MEHVLDTGQRTLEGVRDAGCSQKDPQSEGGRETLAVLRRICGQGEGERRRLFSEGSAVKGRERDAGCSQKDLRSRGGRETPAVLRRIHSLREGERRRLFSEGSAVRGREGDGGCSRAED